MENYFVYKHTCLNGKIYIGITSQKLKKDGTMEKIINYYEDY